MHKEAVSPEASGLVFDRMLSEWLISQCFDLLQLLELCLVRALDLTHFTEYNVAALYSVFLLLPVFLLKRHFYV